MTGAVRRPDIELTRKTKEGYTQTYFHLYWKPFLVHLLIFNKSILFRDKKLKIFSLVEVEE